MADVDASLVKAIAEQVMAALRSGSEVGPSAAGATGSSPVAVHAPIGVCTGDYSKFPELKNMHGAPAPAGSTGQASPVPPPIAPVPPVTALGGVITLSHLRAIKGPIRLARGAILTPLAQDFIKEKNLNVMTDGQANPTRVNSGPAPSNAPLFWWIDGQCPSVARVIEVLRPNVLASRERGGSESLRTVVKELAVLVKGGKVTGGVLFVNSGARAACYANRCPSLRAIVATSDRAVADGIEQLGANVLIVEYPQYGFKGMMPLVKAFAESRQRAPAAVQKELDELRMCG